MGRLDFMSEGLIMLTNHGGLARKLEHPENAIERRYVVMPAAPGLLCHFYTFFNSFYWFHIMIHSPSLISVYSALVSICSFYSPSCLLLFFARPTSFLTPSSLPLHSCIHRILPGFTLLSDTACACMAPCLPGSLQLLPEAARYACYKI